MGGPSYATPTPVKRSGGKSIIWDWNKRDFVPYDQAAADAEAAKIQANPAGRPDAYGEREPGPGTTGAASTSNVARLPQTRRPGGPQPYGRAGSSLLTMRNDR